MEKPVSLTIDCIILAAGTSTRMGSPKQRLELAGSPLIRIVAQTARSVCGHVIVVEGAVPLAESVSGLDRLSLVRNPHYHKGQLGSLQCGLHYLRSQRAFIMLGDLPLLKADTYLKIASAADTTPAVVPVCRGRRGHPVYINGEAIERIRAADPSQRAMEIIAPLSPLALEVEDEGIYLDADTREQWKIIKARYRC